MLSSERTDRKSRKTEALTRRRKNPFPSAKPDVLAGSDALPGDWKETCEVNAKTEAGEVDKDMNG